MQLEQLAAKLRTTSAVVLRLVADGLPHQVGDAGELLFTLAEVNQWLLARGYAETKAAAAYDVKKERERRRQAKLSESRREIAPLPPVADPDRRQRAADDLEFGLRTYFPRRFNKPFADNHRLAIGTISRCVRHGGLFALAMPRGEGKTTLCECSLILIALEGLHPYAILLAATGQHAAKRIRSIKTELLHNELLYADFPEVIHAIRKMEGIANRCNGQTYQGKPTGLEWSKTRIVFPAIPGAASNAVIESAGLLQAVRGLLHTRPDGTTLRPSFALIDDPQTRRSAKSEIQCDERVQILSGDVLYLPGPGKKIAAVMPMTVIDRGDVADKLLDRTAHPEWQGLRTAMVRQWPANMALWEDYAELLRADYAAGGDGARATAFYREHREAMDVGAEVSWEHRFDPDTELSALQHALNLWIRDPRAFAAEAQNDPEESGDVVKVLDAHEIARKVLPYKRNLVPAGAHKLTVQIDVHKRLLYYTVLASGDAFTCWVIDYGTWPRQRTSHFAMAKVRNTIQKQYPGLALEGQIYAALKDLSGELYGRTFSREDGAQMGIDFGLVDANWGDLTQTVYQFCRESRLRLMPAHGRGIKAGDNPIRDWKPKKGQRRGLEWIVPPLERGKVVRYCLFDANWWKSFFHTRLSTAIGEPGCLTLFDAKPHEHQLWAEHATSERGEETEGRGRKVTEWSQQPGTENHYLDNIVGCMVAASMEGITLRDKPVVKKKGPRVTYL